jgi:hypothetical protein
MDLVVVGAEHLQGEDALELPQREDCLMLRGIVTRASTFDEVEPGRACTRFISVPISRSIWPPNRGVAGGR